MSATTSVNPFVLPTDSGHNPTDGNNNSGGTLPQNNVLFYCTLAVGLLFANVIVILAIRYMCRRRRGLTSQEALNEATAMVNLRGPASRRPKKKPKKLVTQEYVDEEFPLMTYKEAKLKKGHIDDEEAKELQADPDLTIVRDDTQQTLRLDAEEKDSDSLKKAGVSIEKVTTEDEETESLPEQAKEASGNIASSSAGDKTDDSSSSPPLDSGATAENSQVASSISPIAKRMSIKRIEALKRADSYSDQHSIRRMLTNLSHGSPRASPRTSLDITMANDSESIAPTRSAFETAPDIEAQTIESKDTKLTNASQETEEEHDHVDLDQMVPLDEVGDDTCAICIDSMEDEENVRLLACGHIFHAACIDPWLTKQRACCPMCKRDYYTGPTEPPSAEEVRLEEQRQLALRRHRQMVSFYTVLRTGRIDSINGINNNGRSAG